MSLEQAILELAGGMKELAAAINAMNAFRVAALALPTSGNVLTPDAELEEAVTNVEQKAAAETKKDAPGAEQKPGTTTPAESKKEAEATPLVYTTDVKPTLLKLNKEKGRDALAGLLKKYDAPNGDKIKQDDLALILADAEALLAA